VSVCLSVCLSLSHPIHLISSPYTCVKAEPVEAASIDLFYAVFSPHGLKSGVIYPTYGLAEHTGQYLRYFIALYYTAICCRLMCCAVSVLRSVAPYLPSLNPSLLHHNNSYLITYNLNLNMIVVYVCSNGQQRIHVDKNSMHEDQILCVLTQDPDNKVSPYRSPGNDTGREGDRVDRITLMGCGRPSQTKGLTLKVIRRKLNFILFCFLELFTFFPFLSLSFTFSCSILPLALQRSLFIFVTLSYAFLLLLLLHIILTIFFVLFPSPSPARPVPHSS
jgi:hypothetical protein